MSRVGLEYGLALPIQVNTLWAAMRIGSAAICQRKTGILRKAGYLPRPRKTIQTV
jgi:hypothetical protein